MAQEVYIVGAGGFAREIHELLIKPINQYMKDWKRPPAFKVLGFLDDDVHALDGKVCDIGIVGGIHDFEIKPEDRFVMGIANPKTKEAVGNWMLSKGAVFVDVIHPSAQIVSSSTHGIGLVAYPGAVLGPDVHVGDFLTLLYSELSYDVQMGNCCTVSSFCGINHSVQMGDRVFVGSHSVIQSCMKIGDDAYIGNGSAVYQNVGDGVRMFGNPAKIMDF